MFFDPPSLALAVLPTFPTAQRDGQIIPPARVECVCPCKRGCVSVRSAKNRTVKSLPPPNTAQVEVLVLS